MNLKSIFPIIEWLSSYNKAWLKSDINAGLTIGILLIPQGIAYAMIAGLPPIYGLYTAMIPQIVYAIFGTSRQLSVGPVAIDSLIVVTGVAAIADIGTDHFIEFAILLATLTGFLQVIFGVFKLGFLTNFLSKPVINGFTSAAALIIGLNQIKHLLGINTERNNSIQHLVLQTFNHLKEINITTFIIGIGTIIIILLLKKYFKKIPSALIVMVLSILIVKFFHLDSYGVKIVGIIPQGLPHFRLPVFDKEILIKLFPISLTISFISIIEAISIGKAVEVYQGGENQIKPNKEFIAIGLSNIIGSFFQSYSATAGLSRSAINCQSGAKTPLASIISASVVALILLFFTPFFYYLPKAALGAIIMVAVFGLIDFKLPLQLSKYNKRDLIILLTTLIVTATIGIKEGVLTGVVISVIMLVYNSTKPHIAVLGQVPGTHFYRNIIRFDNLIVDDEVLIVRFDAQLHFANSVYFKEKIQELAIDKGEQFKLLVIAGESINSIDGSSVYMLEKLLKYFRDNNIEVVFTSLKGPVRDIINKSGLINIIGCNKCFMNIQEAIECFKRTCNGEIIANKYDKYTNQINL